MDVLHIQLSRRGPKANKIRDISPEAFMLGTQPASIPSAPERHAMSDLNFDRAEYTASPTIVPPEAPIPEYYRSNTGDNAAFLKAIVFGIGGAILGSLLYAAFSIATHIEIGYMAIGVAFLVGKAMMLGSGQRGGRNYQIAAAILTYLSVSGAAVPEILWSLHKGEGGIGHISARGYFILARYGVASPFLELTDGFNGIIGIFILVIGIRAAWRITSSNSNTAHHPFSAS